MSLAEDVIKKMAGRTVTLSTCESLTGGGIGAALTSVPGASAVFRGALVTYARELKASLAGVDEELIANEVGCLAEHAAQTQIDAGLTKMDGEQLGVTVCHVQQADIAEFRHVVKCARSLLGTGKARVQAHATSRGDRKHLHEFTTIHRHG